MATRIRSMASVAAVSLAVACAGMLAADASAQPKASYPAAGVVHDPSFIPVVVVGSGFGPPGASSNLRVKNSTGDFLINSQTTCPDPPAAASGCIVVWNDGGIVAQIDPTMVRARLRVETPSGTSESIRVHYYGYDAFEMEDAAGYEISSELDPDRRLWIGQEFDAHDILMFDPTVNQLTTVNVPCASSATFSPGLPGGSSSACPTSSEDLTVDPYGRVWFPQAGGQQSDYSAGPSHDRVVMYDPTPPPGQSALRFYDIPFNADTLDGITYEANYDGLGHDRVWYAADTRRKGPVSIREWRPGWFDPEVAPYDTTGSFSFPVDPATQGCSQQTCPDGSNRSCSTDADCAPLCTAGHCPDGSTCSTSTECQQCGFFRCRDGTNRGCFPPSTCAPICGAGICKADATRPCFNDYDCALGVAGSRACPFDDPSPDCFFHEYELQPGIIRSAHIRVDHEGNVWDTAYWGDNSIVRVDPSSPTNDYVRLPLPAPNPNNHSILASAPWDVEVAANGNVAFSEYMDGAVSVVEVAKLSDPMVDCTALQGTPPNDVNPCIRSVDTWFDALHQVHNIDFDKFQNIWFAQAGACSDPKGTASVGYVKRDLSGYVLLPSPTRFSRQMSGVPSCPPGPVEVGFSGSGLSVDPVSHDVWVGETLRRQIGRFSPLTIDLALGQPATQSSTPCFWGICGSADKANDGNVDGAFNDQSVAIAGNVSGQSWWQVDLGASSWIEEIELWPRTDPCCTTDLANFKVFVSETPFTSSDPAVVQAQPGVTTISEPGVAPRPWSAPVNRTGRYVRVQMPPNSIRGLELAEAVVLGAPLCANDANCNRARGKTATQSSTFSGFAASRAVDGNVDGNINDGSVTHTWSDPNAWWQVDLGQSYDVKDIELWNRTDCPFPCSARLRQFWVFLSDDPFLSTNPAQVQAQAGVTTIYEPGTVAVRWAASVDRTARYVRVQLNGTWQLSLAEVVVAGKKVSRR